jgi:hypothetical protein
MLDAHGTIQRAYRLGRTIGGEALVRLKASSVILITDPTRPTSARNQPSRNAVAGARGQRSTKNCV